MHMIVPGEPGFVIMHVRHRELLGPALMLALLALSATLLDAQAADVTELRSVEQFERLVTHHKPQLNKVLFFSKLGGSSLCDKLADEFNGRLDFAVISKNDNSGLEQRFGVNDFPALRVVITSRGATELDVAAYDGSFKFGAFDEISAWLESRDYAASVPGVLQLLPGDELTDHCGGSTPCVVLLTAGGDAKHDSLATEVAEAYAGEVVTPLQLDATAWPEAAEALGVIGEKSNRNQKKNHKKKKKKKKTHTSGAGTAVFIGPMKDDRGNDVFLHRVLQQAKQFTTAGVQRFVRSSMSLAAESVESGEATEGLTALRRLPRLNGDNKDDMESEIFTDGEDEEADDEPSKQTGERAKASSQPGSSRLSKEYQGHSTGGGTNTKKKNREGQTAASSKATTGDGGDGTVVWMKAKEVATAAASMPLLLLLVSAKDYTPACTAAESLLLDTADEYSNSPDGAQRASASVARVQFGLVSLQAKSKGTVEADLKQLGLRIDQLPAYRWYRNGEPWDWEPPFPHNRAALLAEVATQTDPEYVPVVDPIVAIEDGDVRTAVAQESLTIVAFIEPETKATTQLLPELVKAGRVLSRNGMVNDAGVPRPPVKLMTVDAAAHPTAVKDYGVQNVPWMLLFEDGASVGDVSVSGPRRHITEAIVNLVWERQEGPSSLLVDAEDGTHRMELNHRPVHMVAVLGVFGKADEGSASFRCFSRVAKELREHLLFMHSFDPDLRLSPAWGTKRHFPLGSIVILQASAFRSKYESPAAVTSLYSAMHDADAQNVADDLRDQAIRDWILNSISVRVGQLTPKTWDFMYKHSLPLVLGLLHVDLHGEGASTTQFWRQRLLKASMHPSLKNESLSYAIADSREYTKSGLIAAAGLEDSTAEMSVVILGPGTVAKAGHKEEEETQPRIYPLVTEDDVSEKQLRRFVTDYLEGKIEPIGAGGVNKRGRRSGRGSKMKEHGQQQMPASGVPSPAPLNGVPSPAPPANGVPSPAPPPNGVPSPAPRVVLDDL